MVIPAEVKELQSFYKRQDRWFAPLRQQLLSHVRIESRSSVLDLGAGTGETLAELRRRAAGSVMAVDRDGRVLQRATGRRVQACASQLPFADGAFDLIFTQMFFLWARPLSQVLAEVRRLLRPGGTLVIGAEADYGGVVSVPDGVMGDFTARLRRDGADPEIGRHLPAALKAAGFKVQEAGIHPCNPLSAPEDAPGGGAEFLYIPVFYYVAGL